MDGGWRREIDNVAMYALPFEPDANELGDAQREGSEKRRAKQKNRPAVLRRFLNLELTRRIWSG
ncbi:hypothetical protein EVC45_09585 [Paraburkholderia sp. UYCP14C]|uniref:hypothetical protein n=1 Tax=Paraburkholderia sp. UYCP14C TaxID=2511130 RepID=UPI00101EC772|nr:hypothetical protein [Paraburkholderia sp. UYCP14C]RZF29842.1 hypothetical protein EVC45_09585 [Paraburkholderia sp. UYCP14C]